MRCPTRQQAYRNAVPILVCVMLLDVLPAAHPLPPPGICRGLDMEATQTCRARAIKGAIAHAWRGYVGKGWGSDDVSPVLGSGIDNWHSRSTIYDSLDTLWLAGMRPEFEAAMADLRANGPPLPLLWPTKLCEYNFRVIGGLVGAYSLAKDSDLLRAAASAADALIAAATRYGESLPMSMARLADTHSSVQVAAAGALDYANRYLWNQDRTNSLSGAGSFALEMYFLSRETNQPRYSVFADELYWALLRADKRRYGEELSTMERYIARSVGVQEVDDGDDDGDDDDDDGDGGDGDDDDDDGDDDDDDDDDDSDDDGDYGDDDDDYHSDEDDDDDDDDEKDDDGLHENSFSMPRNGLLSMHFATDGSSASSMAGLASGGDSFYEYLVKSALLAQDTATGANPAVIATGVRRWRAIANSLNTSMLVWDETDSTAYLNARAESNSTRVKQRGYLLWEELSCFATGSLLLSAKSLARSAKEAEAQKLAAVAIAKGCLRLHKDPNITGLGLAPDSVFVHVDPVEINKLWFKPDSRGRGYLLRPETIEALFYLSRIGPGNNTHRNKWRDEAWEIFEAIEAHCRFPSGYSALSDVRRSCGPGDQDWDPRFCRSGNASRADPVIGQPSYFLAETLKYLLLLFEPTLLPLDQFVLTTEAHPLSIFALDCITAECRDEYQASRRSLELHSFDIGFWAIGVLAGYSYFRRRRHCRVFCIRSRRLVRTSATKLMAWSTPV